MRRETISATELARNISASIDRVRVTGVSLQITKSSQTVAELSPPAKAGFPIEELTNMIAELPSLHSDSDSMLNDIIDIRAAAKLPNSPWD